MKTLSGTVGFVALAVIAIVAALAFRAFATATPAPTPAAQKYILEFGTKATNPVYVDLASPTQAGKDAFDKALCTLKANGGQYEVGFLPSPTGQAIDIGKYDPTCRTVSINTDKITTSKLAQAQPVEDSSAYDPHAVYRVMSNSATDIKNVLDTFK
jgi:hypothetical protein